jgi:hypothetical protein
MHHKLQLSAACAAFLVMLKCKSYVSCNKTRHAAFICVAIVGAHKHTCSALQTADGHAAGQQQLAISQRQTGLPVYTEVVS